MNAATATTKKIETPAPRAFLSLRGMSWVAWRGNRTALLLLIAFTAGVTAYCVYHRFGVVEFLNSPRLAELGGLRHADEETISKLIPVVQFLPAALGVFIGAPLLASEYENRTLRLTSTQSVGRLRVVMTSVAVPLVVVVLCTSVLSAALTSLWHPARGVYNRGNWWDSGIFFATGPLPVAFSVFTVSAGILAGAVLRRSVAAMAITFVGPAGTGVVALERLRTWLAEPHRLLYPAGADSPELKPGEVQIDNWVATADGQVHGWGTCVKFSEKKSEECRAELGIVNDAIDYVTLAQMPGLQWTISGILLVMAAVAIVSTVWWTHRRSL
ncbi:transporter [Streptomyces inusitatus]|uniref:Transporter n=1 Tax=Streptomyces inusitatus TaxID=68221 RepID=A0A918PKN2_9ACTN|nr:ABC transporter permease subunit [Streptomyces inusitatus]GGZ14431.1 transporter [Streptomyces inusitatus]